MAQTTHEAPPGPGDEQYRGSTGPVPLDKVTFGVAAALVAAYIAEDGMTGEEAGAKWVEENQDKVDAWLS